MVCTANTSAMLLAQKTGVKGFAPPCVGRSNKLGACRQCCKMSLRRRSLHGDARRANEARKTKPLRARRRDEAVWVAALLDAERFEIEMAQGRRRRGEKKLRADKTRSKKYSQHATPSASVGGCALYTPRRREKFRRGKGQRSEGKKLRAGDYRQNIESGGLKAKK